ncbi:unnamed protein product [Chondrus crispus]|uniref:DDE-1 domain-containing protein n=1 Tax=Chondrus crispus TaxID=2769 RepID=R7QCB5_CHOCR|nr:unnamed protein product [Chondrus crispus]CDF36147.1 unnamed protein product [Chondrus crispus]|eukprot:XP_005715966.1 unnamed protein product [Chondrus crispus]
MLNTSQSISRQNDIPAINPAAIVQAPGNGTATHENASVDAAKPTAGGISPASVPRPSNPKKRPHRSISHAEKRRLCELQDQHPEARHNCIAKLFLDESGHRVERSTVTRVLQRKDFWLKAGTTDSNRKRLTSPRFPIIEEAMYELIRNRALSQSLRSKLHDRNLMQISREIASAMSDKHGSLDKNSPNYSPNLAQFRGSLSWIQSFKKRHALFPEDDESTDGFQLRPPASPLMVYDIWQTELNMSITQRELGDYTRLEDVYMLEATVLATTAMPEHVKEASVNTPAVASQDADAPSNDDFGLMNASYNDRDSGSGGIDSSVPNFIDFPLSSPGSSWNAQRSNSSSGHEPHSGFSQSQPQDSLTCASPNVDRGSRDQASTARNAVDEDDIVVALLCSNAIGQRPAPWLVGRRPLKTVGKREGEVWHDSTIRYFHNAKGWLTARIIKKWLVEFDASVDRPVAVLTSLLTRCDIDLLKLKKVSVMPLPSTSWHGRHRSAPMWRSKSSPLYHGIEETFRTKYRCMVMNKAIQTVCRGTHVKPIPLKATAGMIWEAWGNVPVPVIRRAWRDLSYMPARLHRSCGQPRMKPGTVNAQIHELTKLLRTYKGALAQTFGGVRHSVRPADIEYAINNPEKYVWLAAESSVFHPKGTVADFVRSVCSAQKSKDYGMEDVSVPGKFPTPPITSYEEALLLTNKLAEFMKNDEELNKEQSLYLVSALQLEFKRLYDHRQDTEQTNAWPTANVRSSV